MATTAEEGTVAALAVGSVAAGSVGVARRVGMVDGREAAASWVATGGVLVVQVEVQVEALYQRRMSGRGT